MEISTIHRTGPPTNSAGRTEPPTNISTTHHRLAKPPKNSASLPDRSHRRTCIGRDAHWTCALMWPSATMVAVLEAIEPKALTMHLAFCLEAQATLWWPKPPFDDQCGYRSGPCPTNLRPNVRTSAVHVRKGDLAWAPISTAHVILLGCQLPQPRRACLHCTSVHFIAQYGGGTARRCNNWPRSRAKSWTINDHVG